MTSKKGLRKLVIVRTKEGIYLGKKKAEWQPEFAENPNIRNLKLTNPAYKAGGFLRGQDRFITVYGVNKNTVVHSNRLDNNGVDNDFEIEEYNVELGGSVPAQYEVKIHSLEAENIALKAALSRASERALFFSKLSDTEYEKLREEYRKWRSVFYIRDDEDRK